MRTILKLSVAFSLLFALNSCKKDPGKNNNNNTDDNPNLAVMNLLRPNSAYESVFDSMMNNMINGMIMDNPGNEAGVLDFTVDNQNRLNIVYFLSSPTQQDRIYITHRRSYDLNTRKPASLSFYERKAVYEDYISINKPEENPSGEEYFRPFFAFKPYTNYFYSIYHIVCHNCGYNYGFVRNDGFAGESGKQYIFINDGGTYDYELSDMSFQNPVIQVNLLFGLNSSDPAQNYTRKNMDCYYYNPLDAPKYLLEARADGKGYAFEIREDKIDVIELAKNETPRSNPAYPKAMDRVRIITTLNTHLFNAYEKITTMQVAGEYYIGSMRHYSNDGNTLAFCVKNNTTNKYSTFIYNF